MNELLEFLQDWLAWAEDGAPEQSPLDVEYFRGCGLCSNADQFDNEVGHTYPGRAAKQLRSRFDSEGLDLAYPFGMENYDFCAEHGEQHMDPLRLAWVRKTIQELEG